MSCPPEPRANRNLNDLRGDFKNLLVKYLKLVSDGMGLTAKVHETLRTKERQQWLWNQGRVDGCGSPGRHVTWTTDSNHLYGIAADWHFVKGGQAYWGTQWYAEAYKKFPPEDYGLESLAPAYYVHLQLKDAEKRRLTADPIMELYNSSSGSDVLIRVRGSDIHQHSWQDKSDTMVLFSGNISKVHMRRN